MAARVLPSTRSDNPLLAAFMSFRPISQRAASALLCAFALTTTVLTPSARAAEPWSLSAHYGQGDEYRRVMLGIESAPLWSYSFGSGRSRVDLTAELGLAYWKAKRSGPNDDVWQLNAVPMFRWWPAERFFIEGGIGATVFSRTRFAGDQLSTLFQFGDHLGAGYQLTPSARLGARISHFSNASIKSPNPGLDIFQLTYVQRF